MSTRSQLSEDKLLVRSPATFRNRPIFAAVLVILVLATAGAGIVIAGPIYLLWWIACSSTTLTVTDDLIRLRRGILSKRISEVWHTDVRNVVVSQGILNRMFNVGTIGISSAGQSGFEIEVSGIRDPYGVKRIIDDYRRQKK